MLKDSLQFLQAYEGVLPKDTVVAEYINWVADTVRNNHKNELYLKNYRPIVEEEREQPRVFGSVVMRTQGKRPEALREALLCMYAQSDRDFEVLLIGHKLNREQAELVQRILDELEPSFRKQVRFLPLDAGTRTTPLNFGFAHARGDYIMILDDDDIVLEDWIASYRKAAERKPGSVLHVMSFSQDWQVVDTNYGSQGLRASSKPDPRYCVEFDILTQLYQNKCPTLGYAIPRYAFHDLAMIFDETLTTTEDWDYLMRVATLCGVSDEDRAQAIYRMWVNAESSATVHNEDEWKKNNETIQRKMEKAPVVLPIGYYQQVRRVMENYQVDAEKIRAEQLQYIAHLEADITEARGYIAHLETDLLKTKEYIHRLENELSDTHDYIGQLERDVVQLRKVAGRDAGDIGKDIRNSGSRGRIRALYRKTRAFAAKVYHKIKGR